MKLSIRFPDVFLAKKIEYEDTINGRLTACADAIEGWALFFSNCTMPEGFFNTIVEIAHFLGVSGTIESFTLKANDLLDQKKANGLKITLLESGYSEKLANRAQEVCRKHNV